MLASWRLPMTLAHPMEWHLARPSRQRNAVASRPFIYSLIFGYSPHRVFLQSPLQPYSGPKLGDGFPLVCGRALVSGAPSPSPFEALSANVHLSNHRGSPLCSTSGPYLRPQTSPLAALGTMMIPKGLCRCGSPSRATIVKNLASPGPATTTTTTTTMTMKRTMKRTSPTTVNTSTTAAVTTETPRTL